MSMKGRVKVGKDRYELIQQESTSTFPPGDFSGNDMAYHFGVISLPHNDLGEDGTHLHFW